MDAHEVVLELAAQVRRFLLALEMGMDGVGEQQLRLGPRYEQAEAGELVKLAEGAGEGGLSALVRPRDDDDPLGTVEAEVVGHHGLVFARELLG